MTKQLLLSYGFEPSKALYFVWDLPTSGKMKNFGQLDGEISIWLKARDE